MNHKLTAALLTAIFSGAALAAGPGTGPTMGGSSDGTSATGMSGNANFDNLDQNSDGYLSKDEVTRKPALKDEWVSVDADSNGKLDRSEFSKFETLDSNSGNSGSNTLNSPGSSSGTTTPGYGDPSPPASGAIR